MAAPANAIPHIDATHRTIPNRHGRILEGFSLGGYGAAHLAFKFPDLFAAVSLLDASLTDAPAMQQRLPDLYQRIFASSPERFAAEDPRTLAQKNAPSLRGRTTIRIATGALEDANRSFHDQLTQLNIPHTYDNLKVSHNPLAPYDALGDKNWHFYRDAVSNAGK